MSWRTWSLAIWGYWLMFATGLVLGIFDFKWEVTLGDIALSIIAAIFTIVIAVYRFWLPRHPFNLRFYDKKWDTEDEENLAKDSKVITCDKGQDSKFFIGVQLRTQRAFKTIDIRCVDRYWMFWWKDIPRGTVTIIAIRDQQRGWSIQDLEIGKDNKKCGREANYELLLDGLPRNTIMWYEVTASAQKEWNGWLSFQLRRGSSHKGHARARLCFKFNS